MATLRIMGIAFISILLVGLVNWGFFHPPAKPSSVEQKIVEHYNKKLQELSEVQQGLPAADPVATVSAARRDIAAANGVTAEQLDAILKKSKAWNEYAAKHPEVVEKSVIERHGQDGASQQEYGD